MNELERFMNKIIKTNDSDCWGWSACLTTKGYARMTWKGKPTTASRVSWQLFRGEIPKGMCICHKCDNPKCCNPEHLFLGTHQDNMNDMISKGRSRFGLKPKTKTKEQRRAKQKLSSDKWVEANRDYVNSRARENYYKNHEKRLARLARSRKLYSIKNGGVL